MAVLCGSAGMPQLGHATGSTQEPEDSDERQHIFHQLPQRQDHSPGVECCLCTHGWVPKHLATRQCVTRSHGDLFTVVLWRTIEPPRRNSQESQENQSLRKHSVCGTWNKNHISLCFDLQKAIMGGAEFSDSLPSMGKTKKKENNSKNHSDSNNSRTLEYKEGPRGSVRLSQSCEALRSLGTFAKSDSFLSYALCPGIFGDLTGSLNTIQMQLSSFFLWLQFFGHFTSRQVLLLNERQVNRLCLSN